MKIKISGLGAVPDLQISLRPLTIFVGENGTGKTWTAYTIAGILGPYGFNKYVTAYLRGKDLFRYPPIEKAIRDLMQKGSATLDVLEFSREYAEIYLNEIAKLAPSWMRGFMATGQVDFDKMTVHAELSEPFKQRLLDSLKKTGMKSEGAIGGKLKSAEVKFNCLKKEGANDVYFYTTYKKTGSTEIPTIVINEEVKSFIVVTIFHTISTELFKHAVIFPTERTTFITMPIPQDVEEYRKQLEKKRRTEPYQMAWKLSEPIKNLPKIMESCTRRYLLGEEDRDPAVVSLSGLGKFLEEEILLGNISAEIDGKQIDLMYSPSASVKLELNVSSSMVKELAPLALYLKCLAEPGDFIIIDEPEMNLHPVAQVKLTEFLGMLVNAGLYILVTTHSPYIVDHIPNLIRANDLDKEKVKEHFYLKQATSFLRKEDVSVYLFDNYSVTDILEEDGDINWGTFSNVSRELSSIYSRLIQ